MRLGILTPSSNTVLEPVIARMLEGIDGVSAHFSRFRVTEISTSQGSWGQFERKPILDAAILLADAHCDLIIWCGTSGSWLGFERDRQLCDAILEHTGIEATTSIIGMNEILAERGIRRLAVVTPYTGDIQDRIIENYRALGIECVAERHLSETVNFAFSEIPPEQLSELIRETLDAQPEAVATICTNLRSTFIAPELERLHGVPVLDCISTALWKAFRMKGQSLDPLREFGRIFEDR
jgi:maleate isomerase